MSGGELVLVAEDNHDVRSFVVMTLTSHGFRVLEAGSGWQALQAAENTPPDILLLDEVLGAGDLAFSRKASKRMEGSSSVWTNYAPSLRSGKPGLRRVRLIRRPGIIHPPCQFVNLEVKP